MLATATTPKSERRSRRGHVDCGRPWPANPPTTSCRSTGACAAQNRGNHLPAALQRVMRGRSHSR